MKQELNSPTGIQIASPPFLAVLSKINLTSFLVLKTWVGNLNWSQFNFQLLQKKKKSKNTDFQGFLTKASRSFKRLQKQNLTFLFPHLPPLISFLSGDFSMNVFFFHMLINFYFGNSSLTHQVFVSYKYHAKKSFELFMWILQKFNLFSLCPRNLTPSFISVSGHIPILQIGGE